MNPSAALPRRRESVNLRCNVCGGFGESARSLRGESFPRGMTVLIDCVGERW